MGTFRSPSTRSAGRESVEASSQLQFVSATPKGRYLRVAVRQMGVDDELVPWLAHELWHAVEIAGAPEVRSQSTLVAFYERIGSGFRSGAQVLAETVDAQKTQETVLRELRAARRPPRR